MFDKTLGLFAEIRTPFEICLGALGISGGIRNRRTAQASFVKANGKTAGNQEKCEAGIT